MDVQMLWRNIAAVSLIFGVRSTLIIVSTYVGGRCASSPPEFYNRYWMTFLTQAAAPHTRYTRHTRPTHHMRYTLHTRRTRHTPHKRLTPRTPRRQSAT
jgi:hypothetical protein